jgi:transcriptional regulator with XRE-family HTH domain
MTRPASSRGALPLHAKNIRFAMRIRDWSLGDLAVRSGVSKSHLSRSLEGDNLASPDVVRKIRTAFEDRITWDEMIDWDAVLAEPVGGDTENAAAEVGGP